jgi:hypothetical protein
VTPYKQLSEPFPRHGQLKQNEDGKGFIVTHTMPNKSTRSRNGDIFPGVPSSPTCIDRNSLHGYALSTEAIVQEQIKVLESIIENVLEGDDDDALTIRELVDIVSQPYRLDSFLMYAGQAL